MDHPDLTASNLLENPLNLKGSICKKGLKSCKTVQPRTAGTSSVESYQIELFGGKSEYDL